MKEETRRKIEEVLRVAEEEILDALDEEEDDIETFAYADFANKLSTRNEVLQYLEYGVPDGSTDGEMTDYLNHVSMIYFDASGAIEHALRRIDVTNLADTVKAAEKAIDDEVDACWFDAFCFKIISMTSKPAVLAHFTGHHMSIDVSEVFHNFLSRDMPDVDRKAVNDAEQHVMEYYRGALVRAFNEVVEAMAKEQAEWNSKFQPDTQPPADVIAPGETKPVEA